MEISNKYVSFELCKAENMKMENFMKWFEDSKVEDDLEARKLAPKQIDVETIVSRNSPLFNSMSLQKNEKEMRGDGYNFFRFPIDSYLASKFPFLGQGTQSLVFDIGNECVLKRTVYDGRTWEFDLVKMARQKPGLFSEMIEIDCSDSSDYVLFVQKKLKPIPNIQDFNEVIHQMYFPEMKKELFIGKSTFFAVWEWGLDLDVPRVFDWG